MTLKTISFESAQHVQVEFELARPWQRAFATVIDVLILFFYIGIVLIAFNDVTVIQQISLIGLFIKIPLVLYFPFMEFFFGQSLGKMALGIRLVNMDGERPGLREILVRWVFRGDFVWLTADVFMLFWFGLGLIGFVICHVSDLAQRIGDGLAGTLVIRMASTQRYSLGQIHSIQQSEGYLPFYPGVIRFTDEDMLLIKNTLFRLNQGTNQELAAFATDLSFKLAHLLELNEVPSDPKKFFNQVLQDYIVITR